MARRSFRGTCRTSRFIMFEEWKNDVAAINTIKMLGDMVERREMKEIWNEHVKNIVDWLIL